MTNQEIMVWFLAMQAGGVLALGGLMLRIAQAMFQRYSSEVGAQIKLVQVAQTEMREDMDGKLGEHSARLARVEQDVLHVPTAEDLKRLHARIDDVSGALKRLEGESSAQIHTLRLIHEHLLNHGAH